MNRCRFEIYIWFNLRDGLKEEFDSLSRLLMFMWEHRGKQMSITWNRSK